MKYKTEGSRRHTQNKKYNNKIPYKILTSNE